MITRKIFILILLIVGPFKITAQTSFYIGAVVGQYSMADMKFLQQSVIRDINSSYGLPAKSTLSFPMSVQGEMGVDFHIGKKAAIGPYVNYAMTKARIAYSDYSGYLQVDQLVTRIVLGNKFTWNFNDKLGIYAKVGYNYSFLKLSEEVSTGSPQRDEDDFRSKGLNFEPGLQYVYPLKKLYLCMVAGFEFNFQGKTNHTEEDAYLVINDKPAYIDWTGFRVGLSVGFGKRSR